MAISSASAPLAGLLALALLQACSTIRVTDAAAPPASSGAVRTTRNGAFTTAQAERGRQVYVTYCASCHLPAFYETQLSIWQNATLSEFFDALRATMPSENPGALAPSQYLDVIAYILSITGAPAGAQDLTIESARVVRIAGDR